MAAFPNFKPAPLVETDQDLNPQVMYEPLYRVIIHNDDVTPMDFVVHILCQIFCLSAPEATEVMLVAHLTGAAHVQTLPHSEAEARVNRAHFAAGLEGYPLHFSLEPE